MPLLHPWWQTCLALCLASNERLTNFFIFFKHKKNTIVLCVFFGCGCVCFLVVALVLFYYGMILGCGWVVVSISVLSVVVGGPVVVGEVVGVLDIVAGISCKGRSFIL